MNYSFVECNGKGFGWLVFWIQKETAVKRKIINRHKNIIWLSTSLKL